METKRLKLIPCTPELLQWAIQGNEQLANRLKVQVPKKWTEFGVEALQYAKEQLESGEEQSGWWTYFPVLKGTNTLVGCGGFAGKPTPEGGVEIGYEIAAKFRQQGLATEFAEGLVQKAFEDERVKFVAAHTLGEENPSTQVLINCGFEQVDEFEDPDEGLIWRWERARC